ncbi:MAG: hypothetical protein V4651_01730, partial [Bacteroidota bacterium]
MPSNFSLREAQAHFPFQSPPTSPRHDISRQNHPTTASIFILPSSLFPASCIRILYSSILPYLASCTRPLAQANFYTYICRSIFIANDLSRKSFV